MTTEPLLGSLNGDPQAPAELLADVRRELTARLHAVGGASTLVDCPAREMHAPGIYCRETFIPAGVGLVFEATQQDHVGWVLGDITLIDPDGERRIAGFESGHIPAGERWAVFAHRDSWWTTVHPNPTEENDPVKLRELLLTREALEVLA